MLRMSLFVSQTVLEIYAVSFQSKNSYTSLLLHEVPSLDFPLRLFFNSMQVVRSFLGGDAVHVLDVHRKLW